MHELSYMIRLCDLAIQTAEQNHAVKVNKIVVQVGQMSGVVPEYLQHYYPEVVKGTILEGAALVTEMDPVRVRCAECGTEYHPSRENGYCCPKCHSPRAQLCAGREVILKRVILEDA